MIEVLDLYEVSFAGTKLGCRFFVLLGSQPRRAAVCFYFPRVYQLERRLPTKAFFSGKVHAVTVHGPHANGLLVTVEFA